MMKEITVRHERFMRAAIKKAQEGIRKGQTPFGACIVKNGVIISGEHNRVWASGDITAHAEMNAIRKACTRLKTIDLSGCVLYSTCEPCPMCLGACHWARITTVVYGARIEDARRAGFNELTISAQKMRQWGRSKLILIRNILPVQSRALFGRWKHLSVARVY
jgi:tRNA(Arg) A34 adenosine deaminase TadA